MRSRRCSGRAICDEWNGQCPRDKPVRGLVAGAPADAVTRRVLFDPALELREAKGGPVLTIYESGRRCEGHQMLVAVKLPDHLWIDRATPSRQGAAVERIALPVDPVRVDPYLVSPEIELTGCDSLGVCRQLRSGGLERQQKRRPPRRAVPLRSRSGEGRRRLEARRAPGPPDHFGRRHGRKPGQIPGGAIRFVEESHVAGSSRRFSVGTVGREFRAPGSTFLVSPHSSLDSDARQPSFSCAQ